MAQSGRALVVATILAGLPALTVSSNARAACRASDLAGNWSMYASAISNVFPYSLRCNLKLTNATPRPIRYSIGGRCLLHTLNTPGSEALPVHGTATLIETRACKLRGSLTLSNKDPVTINILDGRIEGGRTADRKTHIEAVGRVGGLVVQLLNMSFVR